MSKQVISVFVVIYCISSCVLASDTKDKVKKMEQAIAEAFVASPRLIPNQGSTSPESSPLSPRIRRMSDRRMSSSDKCCPLSGDECDCLVIRLIKKQAPQDLGVSKSLSPQLMVLRKASKNLK
jgi:hypothetical protein